MKSTNLTLGAILNSPNQYVIPVFQRYYRWDQPEWEKLWADLSDLQQPGKTGRHFLGFLVLVPESVMPGQICRYHLIDGQQRLTTLSLMLCALRDAALANGHQELAEEVGFTMLQHQYKKGTDRYRLYPRLRDRDQYVACLNGEPPAEGRIAAAVRYFSGRLTTIPGAGTEGGLSAFFDLLTQRLEFIYAQLESENPFNIFKSLNSTGVPLGQSDLIRNFVFMQVPVEDQDEFDETLWKPIERRFENDEGNIDEVAFSAFLRDYLMRDGRYVSPSETFEAFQRHFEATEFDPAHVAADLKEASEWYTIIQGQRHDPSSQVESALEALRQLESSTTTSLLLNLYQRRQRELFSDGELAKALRLLSGFILRRLVCNEGSRGYARLFVQTIPALGDDVVMGLRRFLEDRGFPDKSRFIEAFARFNLYGSRYRKAVLEALERAYEHKEPALLDKTQVEHVMPQTLTELWRESLGPDFERVHSTWLHTPGNLTLTGYNPELHNKPFAEKRMEYKDSNIVMTREVSGFESWGEAQIEQRGRAMAEVAAWLWPGPAAPVRRTEVEQKVPPSRFEIRLRYWNGFREFLSSKGSPIQTRKPKPYYSLACGSLAPGIIIFCYLQLRNERLDVGTCFNGKAQLELYHELREHRDNLEAEVGSKLVWIHKPEWKVAEIAVRNPSDPTDETLWPSYFDWMRRAVETFQRILGPRIAKLLPAQESKAQGDPSDTQSLQLAYWTALRDRLIASESPVKPQKPRARYWSDYSIGRSGFNLSARVSIVTGETGVHLIMDGPQAKPRFQLLLKDRDAIERELGTELEWRELPAKKQSHVVLRLKDIDPKVRTNWSDQHAWLQEKLESFYKVFAPRIRNLDAETKEPDAH